MCEYYCDPDKRHSNNNKKSMTLTALLRCVPVWLAGLACRCAAVGKQGSGCEVTQRSALLSGLINTPEPGITFTRLRVGPTTFKSSARVRQKSTTI